MRPITLLDTGPLVAALDRRDQHHVWAVEQLRRLPLPFLTCFQIYRKHRRAVIPVIMPQSPREHPSETTPIKESQGIRRYLREVPGNVTLPPETERMIDPTWQFWISKRHLI